MYAQVGQFDFVNFDDPDYVFDNPHVRQGITLEGLRWAFTSVEAANWFPFTRLSHMLDVQLFGLESGWHHLTNVLIHALRLPACCSRFLNRATARPLAQRLRGVSVRAASPARRIRGLGRRAQGRAQRLLLVSGALGLRALCRTASAARYLWCAAFCLGLMSKPMIVTLPFVLLLSTSGRCGRPRTPACALGEASAVRALGGAPSLTYLVQRSSGAVGALDAFPSACASKTRWSPMSSISSRLFWPAGWPSSIRTLRSAGLAGGRWRRLVWRLSRPWSCAGFGRAPI